MKRNRNEKVIKHGCHTISFVNNALCFLNFKNHANHTISIPQYFFNLILIQKFIFVIF
jgi:hypothetical protein